jgi:hypothetical protein
MQSGEQAQHDNQSGQPNHLEQHLHNNLLPAVVLPGWKTRISASISRFHSRTTRLLSRSIEPFLIEARPLMDGEEHIAF